MMAAHFDDLHYLAVALDDAARSLSRRRPLPTGDLGAATEMLAVRHGELDADIHSCAHRLDDLAAAVLATVTELARIDAHNSAMMSLDPRS